MFYFNFTVAEKKTHRQRHCHHRLPRAWRSSFHTKEHPLSIPTRFHHSAGTNPLLRQHPLQSVGHSVEGRAHFWPSPARERHFHSVQGFCRFPDLESHQRGERRSQIRKVCHHGHEDETGVSQRSGCQPQHHHRNRNQSEIL